MIENSKLVDFNGNNISNKEMMSNVICNFNQEIIYHIPIHGLKMVNEYSNPIFLVWMFPTLFPYELGILEKSLLKVKFFIESKVRYLTNLEDEDHGFSIHHFFPHV